MELKPEITFGRSKILEKYLRTILFLVKLQALSLQLYKKLSPFVEFFKNFTYFLGIPKCKEPLSGYFRCISEIDKIFLTLNFFFFFFNASPLNQNFDLPFKVLVTPLFPVNFVKFLRTLFL